MGNFGRMVIIIVIAGCGNSEQWNQDMYWECQVSDTNECVKSKSYKCIPKGCFEDTNILITEAVKKTKYDKVYNCNKHIRSCAEFRYKYINDKSIYSGTGFCTKMCDGHPCYQKTNAGWNGYEELQKTPCLPPY